MNPNPLSVNFLIVPSAFLRFLDWLLVVVGCGWIDGRGTAGTASVPIIAVSVPGPQCANANEPDCG